MSNHTFLKKYFSKSSSIKNQPVFLTDCPAPVSDIYALRTKQEDELYQALCQGGRHILLYGPGGSGKTHLARKLFYRLCQDYERLAWVEYGTDLRTALTASPKEDCEENRDVLFDRGIQTLEVAPSKTILFIDDAKENAMNDDTLAQITGMGVTILMTSRCKKISPYETWEIAPLTISDCVNLFYAHYHGDLQRKHQKIVRKLATKLEFNVFAVLLLAKVVGELDNLPRVAQQLQNGSLMDHIGQLLKLAELSSAELFVLQCLALMPSGETLSNVREWFNFSVELANGLCDKGWLDKANEDNCFILHDLVREYLNKVGLPESVLKRFLSAFVSKDFFATGDTEEQTEYKLSAVQRALEKTSKDTSLFILALLHLGEFKKERGEYRRALDCTLEALYSAMHMENFPKDLLSDIHWKLAINYNDCGMYSKSLEYYHLCEEYHKRMTEPDNLIFAALWNNIGTCYSNMDDYQKALDYYQKAINLKEKQIGIYHGDTAGTYSNIGNAYSGLEKHTEALAYHKKALELREQLADKPLHTASAHDNIGVTYCRLGEYKEALQHHEKALEARKQLLGPSHPDTAISYYNLGVVYEKLNDPRKSLSFGFRSYQVFSKMLGSEHSHTQQALDTLQERFNKYRPDQDFTTWLDKQSKKAIW